MDVLSGTAVVFFLFAILAFVIFAKTAIVVPQQSAFVVERLGRYSGTLGAGFHILVPFVDVIRYRHSLKETAIDIPAQVCITRDNVQVGVDGVLYLKVLNPERASYGITDYMFAIIQLAQTTLRSEIGKIDLDQTFEERTNINTQVVSELDKASEAVGREGAALRDQEHHAAARRARGDGKADARRAREARGDPDLGRRSATPRSTTPKARSSRSSRRRKRASQQQINEAEGQASAILAVATATAEGIRRVAEAIQRAGRLRGRAAARRRAVRRAVRRARQGEQHAGPAGRRRRTWDR